LKITDDLIKRTKKGEQKAQFELYRECYGLMMKICLRYQKDNDSAKDLVNQAFLKIYSNIDQYNGTAPFEQWMKRVTINTCIDEYRKNKTRNETTDLQNFSEEFWSAKVTASNAGSQSMDAESLRSLIRSLPSVSQQVFNMAVLDGFPYDEVAKSLKISEATCRWHVHFARKTLQSMLKKSMNSLTTLML
jgi:RNA polymerase sigma factor (sigma-70 family)